MSYLVFPAWLLFVVIIICLCCVLALFEPCKAVCSDTSAEFFMSFDGSCNNDGDDRDVEDGECGIKYCLVSHQTLERISLVIRDQLDTSDRDIGKLEVPDVTSVSSVLPSPDLTQLVYVLETDDCTVLYLLYSSLFTCICQTVTLFTCFLSNNIY